MHPNPRKILPVVLLAAAALFLWWRYGMVDPATAGDVALTATGTIEATRIVIAAEVGGRIVEILPGEGEQVEQGAVLARFDAAGLEAQIIQAEAALAQAQANYTLVAAGPAHEQRQATLAAAELEALLARQALDELKQAAPLAAAALAKELAVADKAVDQAATALERLNNRSNPDEFDLALAEAVLALAEAQQADLQRRMDKMENGPDANALAQAEARLALAESKLALAKSTPSAEQLALAQAQVETSAAALNVLKVQRLKLTLVAPQAGRVLYQMAQPGEVSLPGAPLLSLANLDDLTITIFLPEDRYGMISLGQPAQVQVDSFPGQTFTALVTHIADQAEFTPRNVQTAEGRRTMVFAIRLSISDPQDRLKPGMPADVSFDD